VSAGPQSAVDLLVLDPLNPRSVLFQVTEIRQQLEMLPSGIVDGQRSTAAKAALQLETMIATADAEELGTDKLDGVSNGIARIAGLIASAYFA
jgi:uncharacterized alpha-E superfamily protein